MEVLVLLLLLFLVGCADNPCSGCPLGPSEMMECHKLGQFLICNPPSGVA